MMPGARIVGLLNTQDAGGGQNMKGPQQGRLRWRSPVHLKSRGGNILEADTGEMRSGESMYFYIVATTCQSGTFLATLVSPSAWEGENKSTLYQFQVLPLKPSAGGTTRQ